MDICFDKSGESIESCLHGSFISCLVKIGLFSYTIFYHMQDRCWYETKTHLLTTEQYWYRLNSDDHAKERIQFLCSEMVTRF
jgi:hypothetical protein